MKTKLRMAITTLLLVVLGAVLSLYLFQDTLSAMLVSHTRIAVNRESVAKSKTSQKKQPTYNFAAVKPLSLSSLSQASLQRHAIAAVGKLVVPQVGINLPIALGVGNAELSFAAGTLNPNQVMGEKNYALAGHHMAQDETVLFGPLVKSTVGMVAYVTDMTNVYAYQIYQRRYIKATDVEILDDTATPELTLVTCDDDGTGRLAIQAKLLSKFSLTKAPRALQQQIAED